jgi:hypothetical protein
MQVASLKEEVASSIEINTDLGLSTLTEFQRYGSL